MWFQKRNFTSPAMLSSVQGRNLAKDFECKAEEGAIEVPSKGWVVPITKSCTADTKF